MAEIGVIGGSGFYSFLAGARSVELETPFGRPSEPPVVGEVNGREVAFIPRHGADHRFPPHQVNYRANLWALRELGVRQILAPCAVGSLKPELTPGTFVVPDQYVDRTWGREHTVYADGRPVVHVSAADPYCDVGRATVIAAGNHLFTQANPKANPPDTTRTEAKRAASAAEAAEAASAASTAGAGAAGAARAADAAGAAEAAGGASAAGAEAVRPFVAADVRRDAGARLVDCGTMVVINGPRFSTRAESRWHAEQGWSVVGMTGAPEAPIARELALCYTSVAVVTDHDAGIATGEGVTEAEVYAVFGRSIERLKELLGQVISELPKADEDCQCRHVLDGTAAAELW